jgi:hypothetical protein
VTCPNDPVIPDHAGTLMWLLVIGAVILYEIIALATHHQTMSQAVQHGPRWLTWLVVGALGWLIWHLVRR